MVGDVDASLLVQKLGEYVDLLDSEEASTLFEASAHPEYLPIHAYQDLQHIASAFMTVASDSTLTKAVMSGGDVTLASYQAPIEVADGLISNLRSILYGNGEGTFKDRPHCASWFLKERKSPAASNTERIRGAGSSPTTPPKKQKSNPADMDRLKTFGPLLYDPTIDGASLDWIDRCPVKAKKKGGKTPERLCMKYLTQGFACDGVCKKPHVPSLNTLSDGDRKKLGDFVNKSKGLSWTPGREPAGTT